MTKVIKTGLWLVSPPEEDFANPVTQGILGFDPNIFLHQHCAVFALALHDIFGYAVHFTLNDNYAPPCDPWWYLVHAYCYENDCYIDLRGIISDRQELLSEYEDFFDFPGNAITYHDTNDMRQELILSLGPEEFNIYYDLAFKTILSHKSWYEV